MSIPRQSLLILPSTAVQMRPRDCYVRRESKDVCGLLLILKSFRSSVQLALALSAAVQLTPTHITDGKTETQMETLVQSHSKQESGPILEPDLLFFWPN